VSIGSRPEENTLGVVVGARGRRRSADFPASRARSRATAKGATLGTAYLGAGAGVLCGIAAVYGLAKFGVNIAEYPDALPAAAAWVLFVAAFLTVTITIGTRGDGVPGWLFPCYLAALVGVVALDFLAIWPLGDVGAYATASLAAGFGLLPAVTLRPARDIFIAAGALAAALLLAMAMSMPMTAETFPFAVPRQATTLAIAVMPPVLAVFVVQRFRRSVQLDLDRVLVQSTVSAPRFAVGMLASEELARLDLAAEELLDSIASGETALPLESKTASKAAQLATELRLHLIEGRRETWLYHAITESEQLGKSTTLTDPGSLAGLLDPQQRDGLLSAVWLLVADRSKTGGAAKIVLGPVLPPTNSFARRTITIPIRITTSGVPRNRVEPATWQALGRVGQFTTSTEDGSLRVDVNCIVANPAGQ